MNCFDSTYRSVLKSFAPWIRVNGPGVFMGCFWAQEQQASQHFWSPVDTCHIMATKIAGMPAFLTDKNNPAGYCVQGAIEFGMDSRRLIQRCTKPDAKESLGPSWTVVSCCWGGDFPQM